MGGRALGAITTGAGAALAIGFDTVLPVKAKKSTTFWERNGLTKHTEVMHLGKLTLFIFMPEGPGGESLECPSSETWKGAFFISNSLRLKGMEGGRSWGSKKTLNSGDNSGIREQCFDFVTVVEKVFIRIVINKAKVVIILITQAKVVDGEVWISR